MIQILIWFLGFFLSGMGIATVIGGFSLHKEAFVSVIFEWDWGSGTIFTFIALLIDAIGVSLFLLGYYIMDNGI